jgi:lysozyme family protein
MNVAYRLVPGLLSASLVLGSASGAFAAQGKLVAHRAFAYGQVSNLSSAGFTLTQPAPAGSTAAPKLIQVALSSTTSEKARKGTTGALTNGEYAFVAGTSGVSGIAAIRVLYSGTAFNPRHLLRHHFAVGAVNGTSTTSTSISITTAKGKMLTFAITPQTKYRVNKQLTTTAPTFTNGEKVRVLFARDAATKSYIARVIIVVPSATP